MKKHAAISCLLALALLLCLIVAPVPATADEAEVTFCVSESVYSLYYSVLTEGTTGPGTVRLYYAEGTLPEHFVIPESVFYDGKKYQVVEIVGSALAEHQLKRLVIPGSVVTIGSDIVRVWRDSENAWHPMVILQYDGPKTVHVQAFSGNELIVHKEFVAPSNPNYAFDSFMAWGSPELQPQVRLEFYNEDGEQMPGLPDIYAEGTGFAFPDVQKAGKYYFKVFTRGKDGIRESTHAQSDFIELTATDPVISVTKAERLSKTQIRLTVQAEMAGELVTGLDGATLNASAVGIALSQGENVITLYNEPDIAFDPITVELLFKYPGEKVWGTTVTRLQYAQAKLPALTGYSVTYEPNGGTGTIPRDGNAYLENEQVQVQFPTALTRPGYRFLGWSSREDATQAAYTSGGTKTFSIKKNTVLYAVWERQSFTVTWENYDGTLLKEDPAALWGQTPAYDGPMPTRPADSQYLYHFDGWSPEIGEVHADTTYTAQYVCQFRAPEAAAVTLDYIRETVTFGGEYEMNTAPDFTGISISSGTSITEYLGKTLYIRKMAQEDILASEATEVAVLARPEGPEPGVGYTVDFFSETAAPAEKWTYEISTDGVNFSGEEIPVVPGGTVYVRLKSLETTPYSEITANTLPGRPAAPNVQASNETRQGLHDGMFTGFSVQGYVDYRMDGDTWRQTAVGLDGAVKSIAPGTYEVRLAATQTAFCSESAEVTVLAGPVWYTVAVQSADGGQGSADIQEAPAGTVVVLTATPAEGCHFKQWQVVSGTVWIAGGQFILPEEDVILSPVFEAHSFDNACDPACNGCDHTRQTAHAYTVTGWDDTHHWDACAICGAQEPQTRQLHAFQWKTDREATVSEAGIKHEECQCGAKRSENTPIPKLEEPTEGPTEQPAEGPTQKPTEEIVTPPTGEESVLLLPAMLLLLSAAGILALLGKKKYL